MITVNFHPLDSVSACQLKFAVICAEFDKQWVYVRHKDRTSWEMPGGHRDLDEDILTTAKRELFEETGAIDYSLAAIAEYSVTRDFESKPSFGRLYYAHITSLGTKPDSEIKDVEVYQFPPVEQTYPQIQPELFKKVQKWKLRNLST